MDTPTPVDEADEEITALGRGGKPGKGPSPRLVVALILVLAPILYVLSYAPVVRVLGRSKEFANPPDLSAYSGNTRLVGQADCADASLYPAYGPVDFLIDHTPLREPLFSWAQIWDVRDDFENGRNLRATGVFWKEPDD